MNEHKKFSTPAGVVPRLVAMLDHNEDAVIEGALFAISTIYSVENSDWITAVINAGAILRLMLLLDSPHAVVAVKAAYTVVNIEAEEPEIRDQLIEHGLIKKLLNLIKPNISVKKILKLYIANILQLISLFGYIIANGHFNFGQLEWSL